jgi:phosphatidylglycerol:prolipoprotein diacylglycerol transferase
LDDIVPNLYGFFISIGIFLSLTFAQKLIKKKDEEILWGLAFWAIIFGIIGARIYHVIDFYKFYSVNPVEILKIWNGGLGIWGALAGGALGITVYLKIKKEEILPWLDIVATVTPLAQAIGRWGNFFNKEIFGKPTTLPWGIYVDPLNRPSGYLNFEKFHPLFLYESILNLTLFVVLFKNFKKHHEKLPAGIFTALYLGGYSVIRFFLEFLRINPWTIVPGGYFCLNVSQSVSILILAFSIVFLKIRTKNDIHIFRPQRL